MTADAVPANGVAEVPEWLEPTRRDNPRAKWRIVGPLALPGILLLWFSPARVGCHLERAGWAAAIVAHLFGLTVGWGFFRWADGYTKYHPFGAAEPAAWRPAAWWPTGGQPEFYPPSLTLSEYIRAPLAIVVIDMHDQTPGPTVRVRQYLISLAIIEVAMLLLAGVLTPFAAAGEKTSRLYGRCLRLTWWSTSVLAAGGVLSLPYMWLRGYWASANEWHPSDIAALTFVAVWWLWVWMRSGFRYAGAAEGPAWERRTPRCEGCGYTISHLPSAGNCPECGRPLNESLPGHREPTLLVAARTFAERFHGLRLTARAAVYDKHFFERLSMTEGHDAARRVFLTVCGVLPAIIVVVFGTLALLLLKTAQEIRTDGVQFLVVMLAVAVALYALQVVLGGLVCVVASMLARRDVRGVSIVLFHASTCLIMFTVGLIFFGAAAGAVPFMLYGDLRMPARLIPTTAALCFFLIGGVFARSALRTIRRALRQTRWANG